MGCKYRYFQENKSFFLKMVILGPVQAIFWDAVAFYQASENGLFSTEFSDQIDWKHQISILQKLIKEKQVCRGIFSSSKHN
jgi:hypothetical protein